MPVRAILYAEAAVGFGIAALVLYSLESSRLAVRKQGISVQGSVTRSWATKTRRSSKENYWVDYTYTVAGASFKGEERHVPGPLVQGTPLLVWVDSRDPGRCVSDPELRYGREWKWIFMTSFIGLCALVAAVKAFFKRAAPAPIPASRPLPSGSGSV